MDTSDDEESFLPFAQSLCSREDGLGQDAESMLALLHDLNARMRDRSATAPRAWLAQTPCSRR